MNPLILPTEEYRVAFERVTQLALGLLKDIDQRPCFPNITGAESVSLFAQPLPEQGMGAAALDALKT